MARQTFDYTHGDTGVKPTVSLDFQKGERPKAEQFDWYWYRVTEAISGHAAEFDRLDSDDDGIVDEADTLTEGGNLKGDLNAVDKETIWNESGGYIPQGRLQNDSITVNAGTGIASGGTAALGSSLTVNVDDSRYILDGQIVPHPVYSTLDDVPTLEKGDAVYVDGDGFYVEDGT